MNRSTSAYRAVAVFASAALALASLAACGSGSEANSSTASSEGSSTVASEGSSTAPSEPIIIGMLVDQTAYLAQADGGIVHGAQLAADTINKAGGIDGRTIKLVIEDTAADPQKAISGAQKLLTQEHAVALIGGFSSASTEAVAPMAASSKAPFVVASVPAKDSAWTFSTLPPGKYQLDMVVNYLKANGIDKVGALHDPTPYNLGVLAAAEKAFKDAGITLVGAEQHNSDAVDMRPQITKLLEASPGAIFKLSTGPTSVVAAKAMAQANTDIPLVVGLDTISIIKQASDAYRNVLMISTAPQVVGALPEADRSTAVKDLVASYKGPDDLTYVGRGYDALQLLANAFTAAKGGDGDAIRSAMESDAQYDGSTASYKYSASDHYGIAKNPLYLASFYADPPKIVASPSN